MVAAKCSRRFVVSFPVCHVPGKVGLYAVVESVTLGCWLLLVKAVGCAVLIVTL